MSEEWAPVKVSDSAARTLNPIRAIVDYIKPNPECPLEPIPLSIGDPTLDGNLPPPANYSEAIAEAALSHKFDGYPPSIGYPAVRAAVAKYVSTSFTKGGPTGDLPPATADDVILTSGASHAIEMAIDALCNPGDELLIPAPGFSLYGVITSNRGVVAKNYRLDPATNWEVDLAGLEAAVTPKTRAIIITNPSNPCGSNFRSEHVKAIVALAEKVKIPIIADEIYAGLVFDVKEADGAAVPSFTSVAAVTSTVPCLIVGGTAKVFLVPGHRVGWVIRHDPQGLLKDVWGGLTKLSTLIVGPNAICQGGMVSLLEKTPQSYFDNLRTTLRDNAKLCCDLLKDAKGVTTIEPQGAMYVMVRIDIASFPAACGIKDDREFASALVKAKNVVVLPGTIFQAPGFIRIVYAKSPEKLKEALKRIAEFAAECQQATA